MNTLRKNIGILILLSTTALLLYALVITVVIINKREIMSISDTAEELVYLKSQIKNKSGIPPSYKEKLTGLTDLALDNASTLKFLDYLEKLADKEDITADASSSNIRDLQGTHLQEMSVEVIAKGNLDKLLAYESNLEHLPYLGYLDDISLKRRDDDTWQMHAQLIVFVKK